MNKLLRLSLAAILLTSLCHARAPVGFADKEQDETNEILEDTAEVKKALGERWEVEPAELGTAVDDEGDGNEDDGEVPYNELGWYNHWDAEFTFRCPHSYQAITRIQSIHNNYYDDRRFAFTCGSATVKPQHAQCRLTGWANRYDAEMNFRCPKNHYIGGMSSTHNNHYDDRIWKFFCCDANLKLHGCYQTGFTNDWDDTQDYRVPDGYVLVGVHSSHNNYYDDRRYGYTICKRM